MKILKQSLLLLALMAPLVYGQAEWSSPVRISEPAQGFYPQIMANGNTIQVTYINEMRFGRISYTRSTDRGETWLPPTTLSDTSMAPYTPGIIGYGSNVMVLWNNYDSSGFRCGYRTSNDDGLTWNPLQYILNHGSFSLIYNSASGSGPMINILMDSFSSENLLFYDIRSTDFGQNWDYTIQPFGSHRPAGTADQVSFGNYVYLVYSDELPGESRRRLFFRRSSDAGLTWSDAIDLKENENMWNQFPHIAINQTGVIGVVWVELRNVYIRLSYDAGDSWTPSMQLTSCGTVIDAVIALNNSTILIAWRNQRWLGGIHPETVIFNKSSDGGLTWDGEYWLDRDSTDDSWSPALAASKGRIYAVWYNFLSYFDTTTNGVYFSYWPYFGDAVNEDPNNLPTPLSLSAYPNPFNSSTTLSTSNTADAVIAIFDINGRLVKTLKTDKGKAVWDASGVSSGVYFARVQAGNSIKSIKLLLLK